MKKHLFFWASLLVAGLALTACGGDDADDFSDKTTPVAPTGKQKWTVTVGAGVMTRGLNDDLTPNWSADDEVYVYYGNTMVGTLKPMAASNSGSVTLTGELDEADYSTESGSNTLNLRYKYGASGDFSETPNYEGQKGTIADIAANYDYMNATVTITAVDNTAKTLTTNTANFQNLQSIFELTFTEPLIEGDEVMISCPLTDVYVTPGVKAANESFYVAIPLSATSSNTYLDFNVTSSNNNNPYILSSIENKMMQNGKKYTATIKVEAVQLWAGGPWWAVKNIGASDKYDAGSLFAWGETEAKATYTVDNYKFGIYDGEGSDYTKYNATDGKTILELVDDAAHINWGSSWRMPTLAEAEDLINNTNYTGNSSEHIGIFEGKTTGYVGRTVTFYIGDNGMDYWTSTYEDENESHCLYPFPEASDTELINRYEICPIRPVRR